MALKVCCTCTGDAPAQVVIMSTCYVAAWLHCSMLPSPLSTW
jgi:hypothetical protein